MAAYRATWFAVGAPGQTALRCCSCGTEIDLGGPSLDHHSSACPSCGIESVFFSWKDSLVQVVPGMAPPELARAIRWAQEELDELEFVSLMASLSEVFEVAAAPPSLLGGRT